MTGSSARSEMMLQPDGWLPPRGYTHGVVATGVTWFSPDR